MSIISKVIGVLFLYTLANVAYAIPANCSPTMARPFPLMPISLKCIPVPEPYTLDQAGNPVSIYPDIIKDKQAAIALGKMLFWDSQVGSDGLACASCHFHAGADNRIKNQLNPGLNNVDPTVSTIFNPTATGSPGGPNYTLKKSDFPFRELQEPQYTLPSIPPQWDRNAPILFDTDDVVSSQGAYHAKFNNLSPSNRKENCTRRFPTSGPDMPLFNVNGYSVRQVEPRNTPTVINAVFNFRNFWDGRANNIFNGLDPFGMRRFENPDLTPTNNIYIIGTNGIPVQTQLSIHNSSLASQAVGPALSSFEMSCGGKTFAELGRKMLSVRPLRLQQVDKTDSVLGPYTRTGLGINPKYTYKSLIQQAFNDSYWNTTTKVEGYTLMENNFSLFWGLAIQAYEATLVSDDTRYDQMQEDPNQGMNKLTLQEQRGMQKFVKPGNCNGCHLGPEFTAAATNNLLTHKDNMDINETVVNPLGVGGFVERIPMGDSGIAIYDAGFYNIGVRPTTEDIGIGATDPYGFPLSFTRNAKTNANDPFDLSVVSPNLTKLFPDPFTTDSNLFDFRVSCINWNWNTTLFGNICTNDPIVKDEREAVDGAFKTPSLRNVELTGPYFHNGGYDSLTHVLEFYNRGGDRRDVFPKDPICGAAETMPDQYGNIVIVPNPDTNLIDTTGYFHDGIGQASNIIADMAGADTLLFGICDLKLPSDQTLKLSRSDIDDIVAFMKTLTDERVRWEKAPFDHPSLTVPDGHFGDENMVIAPRRSNQAIQQTRNIPAVGKDGRQAKRLPPLQSIETILVD